MPGGRPRKAAPEPTPRERRARGTGTLRIDEKTGRAYALDRRDEHGHRESYEGVGLTLEDRARDAEAWLDRRVAARARAAGLLPETVGDYLERWCWETYRHAEPGTLATRRAQIAHAEPIADLIVGAVTADDVNRVTDAMLAAGLSIRYARSVRATLKSAFAPLVPHVLPTNPVGPYRRPLKLPRRRVRSWDEAPAAAFGAVAGASRWGPLWTLARLYGLRHHELRGLEWTDLNERSCELTVRNKKTHTERVIVLVREVVDELVAWRDDPAGAAHTSATWMFVARGEHRMAKATLDDEFARLVAEADRRLVADALASGLDRRAAERRRLPPLTIHGLRHTAATLMLRRGVPIAKVSEILGHHNPAYTYQMYGWAVPSDDALVEKAILGLLGTSLPIRYRSPQNSPENSDSTPRPDAPG